MLVATLVFAMVAFEVQAAPVSSVWIHRSGDATLHDLFHKELTFAKAKGKQVVVFFTADWCAPCHAIKDMIATSKTIQKKVKRGHFVTIDVDEWRGPAHRLIPGVNPSKLPTIVRVDRAGRRVIQSGGTDLGLLSEEDTGSNLGRLIAGKAPLPPAYASNPTLRKVLQKKAAAQAAAKKRAQKATRVQVLGGWPGKPPSVNWALKVTLQNSDRRRRFFAISMAPGVALEERSVAGSYEVLKFDEHIRATAKRFYGKSSFLLIPVASESFVELHALQLLGWDPQKAWLDVWELDRVSMDGKAETFDKKVPYDLKIEDATATRVLRTYNAPTRVHLLPRRKHRLKL